MVLSSASAAAIPTMGWEYLQRLENRLVRVALYGLTRLAQLTWNGDHLGNALKSLAVIDREEQDNTSRFREGFDECSLVRLLRYPDVISLRHHYIIVVPAPDMEISSIWGLLGSQW